jgi:hypothetical protein
MQPKVVVHIQILKILKVMAQQLESFFKKLLDEKIDFCGSVISKYDNG